MAEELTRDSDAGAILAHLYQNNYFVTLKQARPEPVYQYHPLLREFLLSRAAEILGKERRIELQRISAALLEAIGRVSEAVALLCQTGDWKEMVRTIDHHGATMLDQGRSETLAQWVEAMPKEAVQQHPWAAVRAGYQGAAAQCLRRHRRDPVRARRLLVARSLDPGARQAGARTSSARG